MEQTLYKEEFDKLKEIVDDFVTYFGDTKKDDSEDELDLDDVCNDSGYGA